MADVLADDIAHLEQLAEKLRRRVRVLEIQLAGYGDILDSPRFLIGTVDQIVEDLQRIRARYGVSYLTVFDEAIDAMSPIVAQLAGK